MMRALATDYATAKSLISKILEILALSGSPGMRRRADRRAHPQADRPVCGGFNEAFVLQYWAGYNPRH